MKISLKVRKIGLSSKDEGINGVLPTLWTILDTSLTIKFLMLSMASRRFKGHESQFFKGR